MRSISLAIHIVVASSVWLAFARLRSANHLVNRVAESSSGAEAHSVVPVARVPGTSGSDEDDSQAVSLPNVP
eukprot:4312320-Lingulodinium_polyedra.AAC.1